MDSFLKWTRRGLLTVSSLGFLVGIVVSADDAWRDAGLGIMLGSVPIFLLGMVLFTAAQAGWIVAVGLVGMLSLMGLGFYLSHFEGMIAAAGGLLFPGSILLMVAWVWWFSVGASEAKAGRLRATGFGATARIVAVELQGTTLESSGSFPRYGVRVTVDTQIPGGRTVRGQVEALLPETRIAQLTVGKQVQVRVDPADPSSVAFETEV